MVTKLVGPFQVSNPFEKYARPSNWIMNPQFSGSENSKRTSFFQGDSHITLLLLGTGGCFQGFCWWIVGCFALAKKIDEV